MTIICAAAWGSPAFIGCDQAGTDGWGVQGEHGTPIPRNITRARLAIEGAIRALENEAASVLRVDAAEPEPGLVTRAAGGGEDAVRLGALLYAHDAHFYGTVREIELGYLYCRALNTGNQRASAVLAAWLAVAAPTFVRELEPCASCLLPRSRHDGTTAQLGVHDFEPQP